MYTKEAIQVIKQLINNYHYNIEKIVKIYQLSVSRIVYNVANIYNKFPDIVPHEYWLQIDELLDDECIELLKRLSYKVWFWRLGHDENRNKGTHKIWTNGAGLYSFKDQMYYQTVIDFYYDPHNDTIVKVEILSPKYRDEMKPGCFLLLPMLVMVEQKIIDVLMTKINEKLDRR